jgi:predicted DNA-binding protein YlxM (UPF0122 family)
MKARIPEETKKLIIELYSSGLTGKEISEKLNVHQNTVYRTTKELKDMRSEIAKDAAKVILEQSIPDDLEKLNWIVQQYEELLLDAKLNGDRKSANASLDGMRKTIVDKLKFSGLNHSSETDKILELLND